MLLFQEFFSFNGSSLTTHIIAATLYVLRKHHYDLIIKFYNRIILANSFIVLTFSRNNP